MNIMRSPTRSDSNIGRSGSQPNLSNASESPRDFPGSSTITFRKRKHGDADEVHSKLTDIQNQMTTMMSLLNASINAQNEVTTKISDDIAAIKDQMLDIKKSMGMTDQKISSLAIEQTEMKNEIQNLVDSVHTTDVKISSLESDVHKLQVTQIESDLRNMVPYDDVLSELNDQNNRKRNILIAGIQETKSNNVEERRHLDKAEIMKTINLISENCPEPTKIIRVGKYKSHENRAIKVCFESEDTAKYILRNKSKLKSMEIKVFADQTPYQQTRFKKLKDELTRRTEEGESNLIIKYVKDIPCIVTVPPKN